MKVLVSGAAGFLGTHVMRALDAAGHETSGIDVRATSRIFGGNITKPLTSPVFRQPLDAVIHLAALANPRECDADPTKAYDVNVNGTSQVLQMALASGAKKVIFSSSAHVYGISPRWQPTNESHPLYLQNTYTTTKILGEQLCQLYFENYGLSYTTLRLYNAYGPDQAPGYFIPDMIAKAKLGDFRLKDAGTTKDFVWVDDVAQAFVAALDTNFVGPVNIGTGVETPLHKAAAYIAEAHGAHVIFEDDPARDTRMCADYARASKVLQWHPKTSVTEGLDAIIAGKTQPISP